MHRRFGDSADAITVWTAWKERFRMSQRHPHFDSFCFPQCEEKYRNTLEKCELAEQRLAQFQRKAEQLPGVEKQLAERMQNLQQVSAYVLLC